MRECQKRRQRESHLLGLRRANDDAGRLRFGALCGRPWMSAGSCADIAGKSI